MNAPAAKSPARPGQIAGGFRYSPLNFPERFRQIQACNALRRYRLGAHVEGPGPAGSTIKVSPEGGYLLLLYVNASHRPVIHRAHQETPEKDILGAVFGKPVK